MVCFSQCVALWRTGTSSSLSSRTAGWEKVRERERGVSLPLGSRHVPVHIIYLLDLIMCFAIIMPPPSSCLKGWPPRWQSLSHWHNAPRECLDTRNNTAGRTRPQSLCHLPLHSITGWWLLFSPLSFLFLFIFPFYIYFSFEWANLTTTAVTASDARRRPFWVEVPRRTAARLSHLQPDIVHAGQFQC